MQSSGSRCDRSAWVWNPISLVSLPLKGYRPSNHCDPRGYSEKAEGFAAKKNPLEAEPTVPGSRSHSGSVIVIFNHQVCPVIDRHGKNARWQKFQSSPAGKALNAPLWRYLIIPPLRFVGEEGRRHRRGAPAIAAPPRLRYLRYLVAIACVIPSGATPKLAA